MKMVETISKKIKTDSWLEYTIINYRWVFVLFFLLPASFIFDIYYYTRSWIIFKLSSAPKSHDKKVTYIQQQIRDWNKGSQTTPMCTGRPGWQTISFRQPAYKSTFTQIQVNLVDVLEVDSEKQTVRCEPLVTMGQLTQVLIQLGWTLPVVPEMDDLTVGGLVMGTGIETSSHRHGLFQHICTAFEIVTADGALLMCTETEHTDLFYSVPWSYGTLGFLTAVEIKIIPAKRFVKVDYLPCYSQETLVTTFLSEARKEDENDFVEAVSFSYDTGVVIRGRFSDSADPGKLNEIGRWHKPWFFKHVQSYLAIGDRSQYIPIRDYYHRHSRSIFWELQDIIPFGNHIIFRYLLGWLVPPKVSLLKLTQGKTIRKLYEQNHFIQDMLIPSKDLKRALDVFEKEVKIYPLWLCPFKLPARPGLLRPLGADASLFVDIGAYGVPNVENFSPAETTRRVEQFVRDVKGFQMLYADTYMTVHEFRQMFDHSLYDRVRVQLQCEKAFPQVYDKVCRNARI